MWSTYLWFALIPWAIPLVYEDRIVDVIHDNVIKMHVRGRARRRIRPCFDSYTSHCVCKSATNNSNPRDRLFILVLTKTSYADSMARSTVYSLDKYIPTAVTEWDTIITSGNLWVNHINLGWTSDVNSIRIRACFRCFDSNMIECKILASQNIDVELFAVIWCYIPNYWIGDVVEP
jgi:hypothetical protein